MFLTEMDTVARFDRLVELLDLETAVRRGVFDGTVYEHALPYLEALFRYGTVGRSQPDERQVRQTLERGMHDIWPRRPQVHSALMSVIADIVAYTAKISYPISEWTIQELKDEYARLDSWRDVYAVIAGIGSGIGTGRTAVSVAAAAGIQSAQKLSAMIGPAGLAVSAGSAAIAGLAYLQCNRTMGEIEEEIQEVRIDRGEITLEEWNAIYRHHAQN